MNATYHVVSKSIGLFSLFLLFYCCSESNFTNVWVLSNPAWKEQTYTLETGLRSSVSSSIVHNNTLDEVRNESYIINFFILWTFLTFHGLCNWKSFDFELAINSLKYKCFFHSNKNDTYYIQQIKIYYAHQTIKHNLMQESKIRGNW